MCSIDSVPLVGQQLDLVASISTSVGEKAFHHPSGHSTATMSFEDMHRLDEHRWPTRIGQVRHLKACGVSDRFRSALSEVDGQILIGHHAVPSRPLKRCDLIFHQMGREVDQPHGGEQVVPLGFTD